MLERYTAKWREVHGGDPTTKMGIARHIYVAETADEAERIAARAQQEWYGSFAKVWRDYGANPLRYPAEFVGFRDMGLILCGTPDQVRDGVAAQIAESGCNYFVCRFAYGDLSYDEAARSLDLFVSEVMPHFEEVAGRAAE